MNELNTQDYNVNAQLQYYFQNLVSLQGGLALMVFLALLICTARFDRLKWVVLSLLLYTATLGFSNNPYLDNTLAFPLQQLRALYRPLPLSMLAVLLIPALSAGQGVRWKPLSAGAVAYFVFELVFSGRYVVSGDTARGVFGIVVFVAIFVALCVGASKWLQGLDDVHALLRSVVGAGAMLVVATLYQVAVNRGAIVDNGRLIGTTNNPQRLGSFLALCFPVAAYLFTRRGEAPGWRAFHAAFMGVGIIFLLWSGSRAGMLMLIVGLGVLFRARVGRFALLAVVVGAGALIVAQFLGGSLANTDRFVSTADTRSVVWARLWVVFLANPVLGDPTFGQGENSYLTAAASFGVVGFVPLLLVVWLVGRDVVRMQRLRPKLGEDALLVDLVTAVLASMFMVGFFEGYLIGTVTEYVFCIYLFSAVAAFLVDPVWSAYPANEPTADAGGQWVIDYDGRQGSQTWLGEAGFIPEYTDDGTYGGAPAPFGRHG